MSSSSDPSADVAAAVKNASVDDMIAAATHAVESPDSAAEASVAPLPQITISVRTMSPDEAVIELQVTETETVQDIKLFLFENPDTCYFTSFELYLQGEKLNDILPLREVPGLKDGAVLEMKPAPYNEKSARMHVRRVRDLTGFAHIEHASFAPSAFSYFAYPEEIVEKAEPAQDGSQDAPESNKQRKQKPKRVEPVSLPNLTPLFSDQPAADAASTLATFYPPRLPTPPPCVRSIIHSGWNPVPGSRRLMGDLFYIEVMTLENTWACITAWPGGFYVNSSTNGSFQPAPAKAPCPGHTLVGLLSQFSPAFKKNFGKLVSLPNDLNPYDFLPTPTPVPIWIQSRRPPTHDANRAEDSLLASFEVSDVRGPLRDWNEEFQSCKELPRETMQDRITRDRAMTRINSEFVDAAVRGAIAVVGGCVPPLNPTEPDRAHMFIYNNIFLSFAVDSRDLYKDIGGDSISYKNANMDLKGVRLYNMLDIPGLHTLATAIINYHGHRVIAQSIIPGILANEKASTVLYGTRDNATPPTDPAAHAPVESKLYVSDPEFHQLMLQAGLHLHIKEHTVVNDAPKEGEERVVKLASGADAKGIMGTDGRRYVLDLTRATPRDANFTSPEHTVSLVRPELLGAYHQHLNAKTPNGDANGQDKDQQPESQDQVKPFFNPNVLVTPPVVHENPEAAAADEKDVRDLASFLRDNILPQFVHSVVTVSIPALPADGASLTSTLHTYGINMRYLGDIARLLSNHIRASQSSVGSDSSSEDDHKSSPQVPPVAANVLSLVEVEMLVRTAKHLFNEMLRATPASQLAHATAHFLNCFVGECKATMPPPVTPTAPALKSQSKAKAKEARKKKQAKKEKKVSPVFELTRAVLYERLLARVSQQFGYTLPSSYTLPRNRIAVLRNFCLKTGVQVVPKEYDFTSSPRPSAKAKTQSVVAALQAPAPVLNVPFAPDDILDLVPVVKHIEPRSGDGQDLFDAARGLVLTNRTQQAHEYLMDAHSILTQVHGPLHADVAQVNAHLALIMYTLGEFTQAIAHQKHATLVNEKILGPDHFETITAYSQLATYCMHAGRLREAAAYMTRALYLASLIHDNMHIEFLSVFQQAALLLQEMEKLEPSVEYFKEALRVCEALLGPDNIQVAVLCHQLAMTYAALQQYREAMQYQKRHFTILSRVFGDDDVRTKDSSQYLSLFTSHAVQKQLAMARPSTKEYKNQIRAAAPSVGVPRPGPDEPRPDMSHLSVSEIMNYINTSSRPGPKGKVSGSRIRMMGKTSSREVVDDDSSDAPAEKKQQRRKGRKSNAAPQAPSDGK
eukprot:TRINITY_DN1438_c0_g1_i1.p1 TRINITY_DN1438_c0_g1~~TRINITY_DN1438_c0_g1_i1.p1  ORF type:complete len:1305 (-),score=339.28 TRINITY_DN1438_c0_g1_i1:965-4879(-)